MLLVALLADAQSGSVLRYTVKAHVRLTDGARLDEATLAVLNALRTLAAGTVARVGGGGGCIVGGDPDGVTVSITFKFHFNTITDTITGFGG